MEKFTVILWNSAGCDLDRKSIVAEDASTAVAEAIEGWTLACGDKIKIVED